MTALPSGEASFVSAARTEVESIMNTIVLRSMRMQILLGISEYWTQIVS